MKGSGRDPNVRRRAGALAGIATLAPLAALATAEHADAGQIRITNRHASGEGSFSQAVRLANRGNDLDRLVFVSKLSGSIRTRGATFDDAVALKSQGRVTLRGRSAKASLQFEGENRKSQPGPANSIRNLRISGMGVYTDGYTDMNISGATISGGDVRPRYGVYTNYYDNVSIRRSTIRGFQTGVQNLRSDIVVSDSVIKSNDFGIDNAYAGTEIIRSTITGNTKIGVEAGYYGDSDLRDSTVADNGGVGIFGDIELYNSTVTGNGGAAESYGGDVATFTNSIVIDNPRPDGMAECGEKAPKSKGGNVFGTDCDAHVTGEDVAVDDARLGPLRNNGGATPTVALHSGSPAIGLATNKATKKDQRGVPRDKHPDSGSFERTRKNHG